MGRNALSSALCDARRSVAGRSTSRWRSWRDWWSRLAAPTPALYFGRGKVEEIGEAARAASADLFVSDDQLSPIQERNISEALGIKVIDRTALILDIFAQRARTSEGKLQVELAQLTYLLPR